MKVWRRITLWIVKILGVGVSFLIPLYMMYDKLFKGQELKAIISFGIAGAMLAFLLIWLIWLRRIYYRKLDAVATVEEMGAKTQTNFITVRVLKTIEYMLPFGILAMFMKGLTYIKIPPQDIFFDILGVMFVGFFIFLIHDGLRNYFINKELVENEINLEEKVDKLKKKQAIKLSKRK